uniref:ATP synthase subunit a n=1 Tax=Mexistrophia reticulata TaxID=1780250 RepID=A0A1W6S4K0_9EUPU|nr:ATP synthase subunit 6 [Mexistrophia reticulata]
MMADLFSSLDGGSKYLFVLPPLFIFLSMFTTKWLNGSCISSLLLPLSVWTSPTLKSFNWTTMMLTSVFTFIFSINMLGLSPHTYGNTSNLMWVSAVAILFWGTFLISGIFYSPKKALAHLAPSGAPLLMMPFLIIIELISLIIRPLTLTVRLIANISAGHIVLTLITVPLNCLSGFFSTSTLLFVLIMYMLFEFFVSVIQAYIFTLLLSLYMAEHP